MKITEQPFKGIYQTGAKMRQFVKKYHSDVKHLDALSIEECFYLIANLPYIADPEDGEYIQRPKATLSDEAFFRDCDDKCITLGACLYRRGVPFQFVAVSEDPMEEIHHVVIYADLGEMGSHFLDATYPENEFLKHNTFYETVLI